MTLIVSLRIHDGIVLAGDSLVTLTESQATAKVDISYQCPSCSTQGKVLCDVPIPAPKKNAFSSGQKIISFLDNYGIGTYGRLIVGNKTLVRVIRTIERDLRNMNLGAASLTQVAEEFRQRLATVVYAAHPEARQLGLNAILLGCQLVGFDGDEPVTAVVQIGQSDAVSYEKGLQGTCNGDTRVLTAFQTVGAQFAGMGAALEFFSLQDAVDYATFLIQTTAQFQRFSSSFPTVGGEIDIAFLGPSGTLKWIRKKELAHLVE